MFQFPAPNIEPSVIPSTFLINGRENDNCHVRKIAVIEFFVLRRVVRYNWQIIKCTYLKCKILCILYMYSTMKPSTKSRQWTYPSPTTSPSQCPLVIPSFSLFPSGPHRTMMCFLSLKMNLLFLAFCINGIIHFGFFWSGFFSFSVFILTFVYVVVCISNSLFFIGK